MTEERKIFPVRLLPIQQVMEDHGVEFGRQMGDARFARSPFRSYSNCHSFSISVSRNCWKDWQLDIGGGPVEFIMQLLHYDSWDATRYLASKYFLGSTEGEKPQPKLVQPLEEKKVIPAEILDKGYRIFLSACKLDDDAIFYLRNDRFLSDEEIENAGFKSYPTRAVKQKVLNEMILEGIDPLDIPGFYYSLETNEITFVGGKKSSILIPVKNVEGQIIALQYRKREIKPEESRYCWFSSAFFSGDNASGRNGTSPGSPVYVDKGLLRSPRTVLVTEGIFKAIAVKKQWKIPTISVQGVGNWKPVIPTLQELRKQLLTINRVVIAYDSDFRTNSHVLRAARQLCSEIKNNGFEAEFLLWNPEYKGIDDFLYKIDNPQDKTLWETKKEI